MISKLARASIAALAIVAASPSATAQTAPPLARAAFTDSTAAGLVSTRRVAISSVIVSFQASVGAKHDSGSGMFADKSSSQSMMSMPYMDPALQDAITAQAYRMLKDELTAAGYEIVPEAEVAANASYRELITKVGFVNHSRALNSMGDTVLVSPPSLTPYMPYTMEGSAFESGVTSYLGWPSGWGRSATPGGFNLMTAATFWKLPGLEVAMAKTLNAHVVKAFYVVNIGETTAAHNRNFIGTTGRASASAQLSLMADQTRIAFRSPTGNAKWQKVAFNHPAPAKDGDVVVRLAETMLGGTDFFDVVLTQSRGEETGDFKFRYAASLNNTAAYGREVQGMIASATHSMVGLTTAATAP